MRPSGSTDDDGDAPVSRNSELASVPPLRRCGAAIRFDYGQRYCIHAHAIAVDERTVFVGSENLTATSLWENRELV